MLDKKFSIPFVGLKLGVHEFEFEVNDAFFESIEYSLIQKGKVNILFSLEKKETMMIGNYTIHGSVLTACDRCSSPLEVAVEGNYQLVYKFDTEPSEDETLMIVYPEEFEINIKESINEFITVSLPSRVIHEEDECDEDMLDLLDEYVINTENTTEFDEENTSEDDTDEYVDPRWEALKGLKGK